MTFVTWFRNLRHRLQLRFVDYFCRRRLGDVDGLLDDLKFGFLSSSRRVDAQDNFARLRFVVVVVFVVLDMVFDVDVVMVALFYELNVMNDLEQIKKTFFLVVNPAAKRATILPLASFFWGVGGGGSMVSVCLRVAPLSHSLTIDQPEKLVRDELTPAYFQQR
jgi:hypothetical protein